MITTLSSQGIESYNNQPHTKQQNTLTIKLPLPPPSPPINTTWNISIQIHVQNVRWPLKCPLCDIMLLVCQRPYLVLFNSALSSKHSASYFCLFKKVFHNIQVRKKKNPPSTTHHPYSPPSTSSYLLLPIHFITSPPHPLHHLPSSPSISSSILFPIHFFTSPPPHSLVLPMHHKLTHL